MVKITNIFCADFETSTSKTEYFKLHHDSIVYLGYMKHLRTDEDYKFTNINEFYQLIRGFKKSALIYFHNLSFDGYFLYKCLLQNGIRWYNDIPKKITGFSIMRNGTKIYKITFKFYNKKKYITVHFKCSLRILSSSINDLGLVFGIFKHQEGDGEEFYNNEPNLQWEDYSPRFLEYTLNDVEVQRLSLLEFEKSMDVLHLSTKEKNRKIDWTNALTIGGLGMKIQRNYVRNFSSQKYNNDDIFQGLKISDNSYKLAQKFYYGGWTQFNPLIQNKTIAVDGFGIDINSAHPASMTKLLPYGDVYIGEPPKDEINVLEYFEIRVKNATQIYPEVVNLLNWNKRNNSKVIDFEMDNRYTKIQNNFTCFYLKEEWELLQKFYVFSGVKIVKKYWMKADYFLKDYVEDVYALRCGFKDKGEIAMSNVFKILLNSSYGKWGTRQVFTEEYICTHKQADYLLVMKNIKIKVKDKVKRYIAIGKSDMFSTDDYAVLILQEDIIKNKNYNKWIAATITAHTRISLWSAMLKVNPENFLYGDTDSLYLKKCSLSKIDVHKSKLGSWDIECKDFQYFRVNGAKVYTLLDANKVPLLNKSKYSGISARWLKKNISLSLYDTQDSTIKNSNTRPLYLKSGIAIVEKDYTPGKRML